MNMKKQFLAKLLVLAMVLSMVPFTMLAVSAADAAGGNDPYNNNSPYPGNSSSTDDTNTNKPSESKPVETKPSETKPVETKPSETKPVETKPVETNKPGNTPSNPSNPGSSSNPTTSAEPEASASAAPAAQEPVVIDKIETVKTETNEAGQTVKTATIEVADATAPVAVTAAAMDSLVEQASAGDVIAISAPTTGAVTVPSTKLAELIEKTGNAVSVGNSVASVAVNKALVELAGGAEVKIAPVANEDGTISVPVMAGDKEIKPEDVPGGIAVAVPVSFPVTEVKGVFGVRTGLADVELEWSIQGTGLQINLTISAAIRIGR